MATSSFDKKLILDTPEAVDSFVRMLENPAPRVEIKRNLLTEEDRKRGEEILLKKMSSR